MFVDKLAALKDNKLKNLEIQNAEESKARD